MKVTQLAELLGAKVVCPADREIACGYSCDLLSWVMAHGKQDMAWVTVQAHLNVIAVAVLAGYVLRDRRRRREIPARRRGQGAKRGFGLAGMR